MPTISHPVLGQRDTVITGIYVARGEETLGPYNSLEAAALVASGHLRVDDYAARDSDATWVPLSEFLLPSSVDRTDAPAPAPVSAASSAGTPPQRWRHLAAAFAVLLLASLIVLGATRWLGPHRVDVRPSVVPLPPPVPVAKPAAVPMSTPQDLPPTPIMDGTVHGSLIFGSSSVAGVRVSIYPSAELETALAPIQAETQAARARLDPLIEAAAAELAKRANEAQAALQALREADPGDPLIASLRFADAGARAAAKTAENDYRYLRDERTVAAGGEVYFRALPEPTLTTDTDAEGNFTLSLPPGDESYAAAVSVREMGEDGSVRSRYWLVKLSPLQRAGREGLRLDGHNVSSSLAVESLIQTAE